MWVLGFPADHEYPAGAAACIGCSNDPFGDKLAVNNASVKDAPVISKWLTLSASCLGTRSAMEMIRLGRGMMRPSFIPRLDPRQRVQYDAYRLALGLIHYHNALPQQNRVDCAEWLKDDSKNKKTCRVSRDLRP